MSELTNERINQVCDVMLADVENHPSKVYAAEVNEIRTLALRSLSAQSASGRTEDLERQMDAWEKLRACKLCYGAGPFSSCVHYHNFVKACSAAAPTAAAGAGKEGP